MKILKSILLWFLVVFYFTAAMIYMPHISGLLAITFVLLILPIGKWQNYIGRIVRGKWKTIICVALALLSLMLSPSPDTPEPGLSQPHTSTAGSLPTTGIPTVPTASSTSIFPSTSVGMPDAVPTTPATLPAIPTATSTVPTTVPEIPTMVPTEPTLAPTVPATLAPTVLTTAPTTMPTAPEAPTEPETYDYILNTSTKKYHKPGCIWADKIDEENKEFFHGTKDELEAMGYAACKKCYP